MMKGALVVCMLMAVVLGVSGQETFSEDFVSGEGAVKAREVHSVAVATNPELATPATIVEQLPSEAAANEETEATDEADEAAFVETADEEADEETDEAEEEEESDDEADEEADEEEEEIGFLEVSDAPTAAAIPPPPAPPVPVPSAQQPTPPAVATPQPPAAPPTANPFVQKKASEGGMPDMAGPAVPDVSTKLLRKAQLTAQRQRSINRRLRNQIRRLRREMAHRLNRCKNGTCPRSFPIYVGPEGNRHLSTETRTVYVLGDRERNKKVVDSLDRSKAVMWHPPKLRRVAKAHRKFGKNIDKHHRIIKRISNAPLVERKGRRYLVNYPY